MSSSGRVISAAEAVWLHPDIKPLIIKAIKEERSRERAAGFDRKEWRSNLLLLYLISVKDTFELAASALYEDVACGFRIYNWTDYQDISLYRFMSGTGATRQRVAFYASLVKICHIPGRHSTLQKVDLAQTSILYPNVQTVSVLVYSDDEYHQPGGRRIEARVSLTRGKNGWLKAQRVLALMTHLEELEGVVEFMWPSESAEIVITKLSIGDSDSDDDPGPSYGPSIARFPRDVGLARWKGFSQGLTCLDIDEMDVHEDIVIALVELFPTVTDLSIRHEDQVSESLASRLVKTAPSLNRLSIRRAGAGEIGEKAYEPGTNWFRVAKVLVRGMPGLRELRLPAPASFDIHGPGCARLGPPGVDPPSSLRQLESMRFILSAAKVIVFPAAVYRAYFCCYFNSNTSIGVERESWWTWSRDIGPSSHIDVVNASLREAEGSRKLGWRWLEKVL